MPARCCCFFATDWIKVEKNFEQEKLKNQLFIISFSHSFINAKSLLTFTLVTVTIY